MLNENPEERAGQYIASVESALADIKLADSNTSGYAEAVVDAARRYASDAQYLLSKGKHTSALAAIAYAEGLLDALGIMKLIKQPFTDTD